MHFHLINSFVSANDEEYVRSASLVKEFSVNQGSRKILLTVSVRFFIVLIVSFSRKMKKSIACVLATFLTSYENDLL